MNDDQASVSDCVRRALAEDLGDGALAVEADVTGRLSVPPTMTALVRVHCKAAGVLAGLDCAVVAFTLLDQSAVVECHRDEGAAVGPGDVVMTVRGRMRSLLAAERTALNFMQRLSGVATATAAYVAAVRGTSARILDTRKTTPGLRALEKRAVVAGGGYNHRHGLWDQVLLKENHFACARPHSHTEVVRRCVESQSAPVVAEARTEAEAVAVTEGGAAVVLLDNFAPGPSLLRAVQSVRRVAAARGRMVEVEASGGVRLDNVRAFADCGVDRISIGALTHSAAALDLSLLVEET